MNCSEGSIAESLEASERRDLFAGDGEFEGLGVAGFEGRPEGIGRYLKL